MSVRSEGFPVRRPGFMAVTVFMFSLMAAGEASARLADAVLNFDGKAGYPIPAKLSETGLYANIALKTRTITDGITPYEVNTPLWSDGAHKERYITVPAGTAIAPTDTDHYAFPDKSVLIKNFAVDTIVGDDNSLILVETRFIVIRKSATGYDFRGLSYAWNREQTDAYLVDQSKGMDMVIPVRSGGAVIGKRWRYPSRFDCSACHLGRKSLGFITPQLNRPSKTNPSVNQLAELFSKGVLSANPLIANPNAVKWAALDDASASLETRARSYLASNCSHCHGNGNKDIIGYYHDFDFLNRNMVFKADTSDPFQKGPYVGKASVSGDPSLYPQLLYPGHADSSLIIKRMLTRGTFELNVFPEQMPMLATYEPDSVAVRLLADWTCSLGNKPTGAACKLPDIAQPGPAGIAVRPAGARPGSGPRLHASIAAGFLRVDIPGAPGEIPVLVDLHGRAINLRPAGAGRYAIPEALAPGSYLLHFRGQAVPVVSGI